MTPALRASAICESVASNVSGETPGVDVTQPLFAITKAFISLNNRALILAAPIKLLLGRVTLGVSSLGFAGLALSLQTGLHHFCGPDRGRYGLWQCPHSLGLYGAVILLAPCRMLDKL
jgi:hypothetical protein